MGASGGGVGAGDGPGAPRRAVVVGAGLIGGSIGRALRARGWHVTGSDTAPDRATAARAAGALDAVGDDPAAEIVFVATPVAAAAAAATAVLSTPGRRPDVAVTDVSGVKAPVVAAVDHPRFVGGHPMAGSEQVGLAGADPDLFVGATWVLTPTAETDPATFARVRSVAASLGSDVVALSPDDHDRMVAVVSHVPHLVAATLMNAAAAGAERDSALLRLAAGGFRDMTRISAGHPGIWPDICVDNAPAIVDALDRLLGDLQGVRDQVAGGDRASILVALERASAARRALPARVARPESLAELRIPVPDRRGVLAELTTLAGDLGINIYDVEIAHSAEGPRGVLVLVVDAAEAATLHDAVTAHGYRCTVGELS
ncbi:MAG TPA: prephenate dehydrogenase/arogenate dehydrogenase family protein [Acidimicrobiales bacterium]|nr:prephenate dehydrogenase/arogenate dehydrogenase family protein [Acidimicrobiales bacterium]